MDKWTVETTTGGMSLSVEQPCGCVATLTSPIIQDDNIQKYQRLLLAGFEGHRCIGGGGAKVGGA